MSRFGARRVAIVHDPRAPQLQQQARRLAERWWVFLVLGLAALAVGALLVVDVFTAIRTLALLAGLGLLTTGLLDLLAVDRFQPRWLGIASRVLFLVAGTLAIAWPGVTLRMIAILTGVGLVIGGAVRSFGPAADRSHPRWWLVRAVGLVSVAAGVLALVWPRVTVLVLAVILGLRTVALGAVEVAFALSLRRLNSELPSQPRREDHSNG